ncbi:sigma-70 family RNA polymerase sigma factor [Aestuariicoccus sp. MJ-SS9]|uniref:RNA polymerase sigma factor n=1 Tax=Aestuariicoccus sp. MJ-SS9 TaxID=3079855 RepID=UPI002912EF8A|nr:sigma-70 family RNA polymerase sigma factor [Aestuariicoccus sp. MJ-SS9]MDU8913974.1 sigma-70 family RNA polymerase sigma factor [Aestuariicoccus sp. MJ-SS9]
MARVYDRLFRLCFRLTGSQHEAEDLCQDICAALPSKLNTYDRKARVTTWLYRVAVNAAHDRRRRMATQARAADGWRDWEVNRKAVDAETRERMDWLSQAMRTLPDELCDTLALTLDNMTHAEAGEVLGVAEGTVSWRLAEARRILKSLRKEEGVT